MRSRSPSDPTISNHCSPLLTALSGLTVARTRQALLYVLLENGRLASGDDPRLIDRKAQVVLDSGLLEYLPPETIGSSWAASKGAASRWPPWPFGGLAPAATEARRRAASDKNVGETEKNFRRAIDPAAWIAPAVLWIDEIENALAGGSGHDGGRAAGGSSVRF